MDTTKTAALALVTASLGALLGSVPAAAEAAPPSTKVIGGGNASTDEYPSTMWITDSPTEAEGAGLHCGGTLVRPTKVVTAAHCVDEHAPERISVVGGRSDLRTDAGEVRSVAELWIHPDWAHLPPPGPGEPAPQRPDVAVITLDRPMPYATTPVATAQDAELYAPGTPARILGWGVTDPALRPEPGKPIPTTARVLQQAQLPLAPDEPCLEASRTDAHYPVEFDPSHVVCARYEQGGVGTHGGDSGGPLVVDGTLIGLTTGGTFALDANYSTFTEIRAFADELEPELIEQ